MLRGQNQGRGPSPSLPGSESKNGSKVKVAACMSDIERRGIRYDVGNESKGLSTYVYVKHEDLEQTRLGKSENRYMCKLKVDTCFY